MKTKELSCLFVVLSIALVALADDEPFSGIWVGGSTQFLDNKNNWKDKVVPGRVKVTEDGVTTTNGSWGCTMIFDGRSTWPNDLRAGSLVSTWKMVFKGANLIQNYFYKYQDFYIEAGGGIYVEEDAGHVPYFEDNSSFNVVNASATTNTVTIRNDSTLSAFKFAYVGNKSGLRAQGYTGSPTLRLEGKGNIKFAGPVSESSGSYAIVVAQESDGEMIFDSNKDIYFKSVNVPESATKRIIRLVGNPVVMTRMFGGLAARPLVVETDVDVLGTGIFYFGRYLNDPANISIAPGKTLLWDVTMKNKGSDGGVTLDMRVLGGGCMVMGAHATNLINGSVIVEDGSSLHVNAIGAAGAASPLGTGSAVTLKGGSSLVYAGTGDTSDRTLTFGTGGGSFVHAGTGNLSIGAVSLSATSSIVVSNDVTLTCASLTRTAGSLDIVTPRSGKVVVSAGLSAGRAPDWLTVNGKRARVAADGTLLGPQGLCLIYR